MEIYPFFGPRDKVYSRRFNQTKKNRQKQKTGKRVPKKPDRKKGYGFQIWVWLKKDLGLKGGRNFSLRKVFKTFGST